MQRPFAGELSCQGVYKTGVHKGMPCSRVAYYAQENGYFCGTHSKAEQREKLEKNPHKAIERATTLTKQIESVQNAQKVNRGTGNVICSKMFMMKKFEPTLDYQTIFPNFKHKNRRDGKGYPSLSPMSLGSVQHNIDTLPPALSLEGFWQGSKLYEEECHEKIPNRTFFPNSTFYLNREMMFLANPPLRRKPNMTSKVVAFVWEDKNGCEEYLDYLTSRQVYCHLYERLVEKNRDLIALRWFIDVGYNLNIVGYDGYDFHSQEGDTLAQKLLNCYLDTTKPFGHELCLVSLLVLKPKEYPWRIYKILDF